MQQELIELKDKITRKELLLGIIGLGYVGLPLSLTFLRKDIAVLGFDLDEKKIKEAETAYKLIVIFGSIFLIISGISSIALQ